jgi:23S rRNA pseudouridine955/2504/2580 synthase
MAEVSKNSVTTTLITENEHGQRLDNLLLKKCKGVPKSHVYSIVRSGQVRVNGRRAEVSYRLQSGDLLRMPPLRIAVAEHEVVAGAELKVHLPVIFEDDGLLVVDKPAGIAVHGGSGESFGVIEALRRQRPQARFLELAHRLDRETSGVLLLGKKRSVLLALHEMFRAGGLGGGARGADKRYLVLVCGRWMDPLRNVRLPLLKYLQASGERRVRVSEEGKAAHTYSGCWRAGNASAPPRSRTENRAYAPDPRSSRAPRLSDRRRRKIRRFCAQPGGGAGRAEAHVSSCLPDAPAASPGGTELVVESALPLALQGFVQSLSARERQDYGEKI